MGASAGARATMPRWAMPAGAAALMLVLLAVFASIGGPHGPLAGLAAVIELLLRAGLPAWGYLLAGVGWGEVFAPLLRGSRQTAAVRAALGLGLLLSMSHGLGCLGVLGGAAGMSIAAGLVVVGLVLLARRVLSVRENATEIQIPAVGIVAVPALALLLVAACNPPGWLWSSEAGGYDALEYHLELPQEWLRLGRVMPVRHNVYSFLPGYVETAFCHLAVMTGAPAGPSPASRAWGLVAGDGTRVISCQLFSAGLAVFAAGTVGALAKRVVRGGAALAPATPEASATVQESRVSGTVAAALLLSTPWVIVCGSLAYNDLAVVAFLAAAMVAAMDVELAPWRRGAVVGLLIGFACGCKPTAIFLAGVPAGIVLLAYLPVRAWVVAAGAGVGAGVIAIAPWLVRNWWYSGNPVFPFGAGVFGTGHWTLEQARRYVAGHGFHGSLAQRLRLLFLPDPSDPAGPVQRGLLHVQWFAFFPAVAGAAVVAIASARTRRVATVLLLAMIAQLIAWLFFTHVQSRFLLPLAAPGCALIVLGASVAAARARVAVWVGFVVLSVVQAGAAIWVFGNERNGQPNSWLIPGPAEWTGELFSPEDRVKILKDTSPAQYVNFEVPVGRVVYLLGDATPLYYAADVRYNTTWDTWPLAEAIRAAPGQPEAWTRALRAQGISLVLVSTSELARLARSGWIDPAITPEAVEAWLKSGVRTIRSWPQGWMLVELPQEMPR